MLLSSGFIVLPDEILEYIFHHISVAEIMECICQVCKRWNEICKSNYLWSNINLDEWLIDFIPEQPFSTIMAHSSAFTYFSMRNVKISDNSRALFESLAYSKNLIYLDLSYQVKLTSIDFLGKNTPNIEYFLIDNCVNIRPASLIECVRYFDHLQNFSMNGLVIPDLSILISNLKLKNLYSLSLAGSYISFELVEYILENSPKLIFLELTCTILEEGIFKELGREYDVNISFPLCNR